MSLLDNASLVLTPNAVKASKLYSVIPSNGNGDFTATRATTATRINSSGLIESVALNVPRLDYSLGGCPNILLEPQRTNLALQSSSFDSASWSKVRFSATANTTTAPDGTLTADTISMTQVGSLFRVITQVVSGTTLTYTASVYFKYIDRQYIQFTFDGTFGGSQRVNIDLLNGVITADSMNGGSTLTSVGNGWYKITATSTGTNTQPNFVIWAIDTDTASRAVLSTGSGSTFIWGAQVEEGAYATSYIPTTTASVTRNADSITRNNIFTNGLITAAGGTWFVELRNNVARVRDTQSFFGVGDTTPLTVNSLVLIPSVGSGRLVLFKAISSSLTSLFTTTTDTCKLAIKWNGSTADVFQNGVKVVSATAFTPTNMNILGNPNIGVPLFINEMALFPTPLTDAQCLALTA